VAKTYEDRRTANTGSRYIFVVANSEPPIDSVHRALILLGRLRDGATLSVKDAAEELQVVPSTAHRLLNALCFDDFAVQDRDRHYRLGPAFRPDESRPVELGVFRNAVRPVIEDLSAEFGETVHVWVRQGPLLRWVDGVEGTAPAHVSPDRWDRVPAYASAAGKALLSELTNRQLEEVFASGLPPARASRITNLRSLKRHLSAVRSRGYAISIEEAAQGVDGVAICAKDPCGRPLFAISLAIPSSRFDRAELPRYVEALNAAVQRTEENLGAARTEVRDTPTAPAS
jgi:DNA-binding IclR family transcriptional regulator